MRFSKVDKLCFLVSKKQLGIQLQDVFFKSVDLFQESPDLSFAQEKTEAKQQKPRNKNLDGVELQCL